MGILETVVFGNTVQAWLIGAAAALAIFIGLRLAIRIVHKRLAAIAERTTTRWDNVVAATLGRTQGVFLIVFALFLASLTVGLSQQARGIVAGVAVLALFVQGGIWASTALKLGLREYAEQRLSGDAAALMTMNAVSFIARLALWSIVLLLALDNLGIDVTALVTGLGIGGIAVALAAQNILGDLFASLSNRARQALFIEGLPDRERVPGHRRAHRTQDHPSPQSDGRGTGLLQRRSLEQQDPQLRAHVRAPGGL
jgi:small-conductance mechanosensitive channel